MKYFLVIWINTLVLCAVIESRSVQGVQISEAQWTWVGGSNIGNVKTTTNTSYPGARNGATTWVDDKKNIWMFGGHDMSKPLNDLWMFNAKSKSWSLKDKGISNITRPAPCVHCAACSFNGKAVVFGSLLKRKGKSSSYTWMFDMKRNTWRLLKGRNPTPRTKLSYWCDQTEGKLWVFGGDDQSKIIEDLWMFSLKNTTWDVIDMSKMKSFPDGRFSATTWALPGKLFLFGGQGEMGMMSDLWVFSTKDASWKMVKGSRNASQAGIDQNKGIASKKSMPGCRRDAASWVDENGNLWMFGGSGCDKTGSDPGFLSDLWLYNTTSNLWSWIGGLSVNEGHAKYGKKGQRSPTNLPGPRESAVHFTIDGNFWLFGGSGHDSKGADGLLNDLWTYGEAVSLSTLGPPTHGKGLSGDTLEMSYSKRILIAITILSVVMIGSLFVCYRKECNIWCWRVRHQAPKIRYEPIKVKMQVPDV